MQILLIILVLLINLSSLPQSVNEQEDLPVKHWHKKILDIKPLFIPVQLKDNLVLDEVEESTVSDQQVTSIQGDEYPLSDEQDRQYLVDVGQYWWLIVIGLLVIHNLVLRRRLWRGQDQQSQLNHAFNGLKQDHQDSEARCLALQTRLEEQKAAEYVLKERMENQDKYAILGGLTAGIAHEVNNPNNFVHLSAGMLSRELLVIQEYLVELAGEDADPEIINSFQHKFTPLFSYIDTIMDGTDRIKVIVNDLRSYTQPQVDPLQTVKITELIRSTVHLVQSQYKKLVDFRLEFAQSPMIQCYPAKLNQVLMNLVVNACHAIEQSRQLVPIIENEYMGVITIKCIQYSSSEHEKRSEMVEVSVIDTGCGMSEEIQQRIFEPYFTTKSHKSHKLQSNGTGLGLSISAQLVAQHQGTLTCESQLGQGSRFVMRLPLTIN